MYLQEIELYNVHELLEAPSIRDLVTPEAWHELELRQVMHVVPEPTSGEGLWFCRIPNDLRRSLNPLAMLNGLATPGAEMRFRLLSDEARITLRGTVRPSLVEVFQGSFQVAWHPVGLEDTEIVVTPPENMAELRRLSRERGLPYSADLVRVLLPRGIARLVDIEGEFASPEPGDAPDRRLLMYGSSITHGGAAMRPSGSYAQKTAALLKLDNINLGFGGGAHLEADVADYIAGRDDWELATLEMGINILSIEVDDFRQRVEYFVTRIAEEHADKWIFAIDLFSCRHDFYGLPKIDQFRQVVRDRVRSLDLPRLVYLPGNTLLTREDGLTADLVHPAPLGMEEMAQNLSLQIAEHVANDGTGGHVRP